MSDTIRLQGYLSSGGEPKQKLSEEVKAGSIDELKFIRKLMKLLNFDDDYIITTVSSKFLTTKESGIMWFRARLIEDCRLDISHKSGSNECGMSISKDKPGVLTFFEADSQEGRRMDLKIIRKNHYILDPESYIEEVPILNIKTIQFKNFSSQRFTCKCSKSHELNVQYAYPILGRRSAILSTSWVSIKKYGDISLLINELGSFMYFPLCNDNDPFTKLLDEMDAFFGTQLKPHIFSGREGKFEYHNTRHICGHFDDPHMNVYFRPTDDDKLDLSLVHVTKEGNKKVEFDDIADLCEKISNLGNCIQLLVSPNLMVAPTKKGGDFRIKMNAVQLLVKKFNETEPDGAIAISTEKKVKEETEVKELSDEETEELVKEESDESDENENGDESDDNDHKVKKHEHDHSEESDDEQESVDEKKENESPAQTKTTVTEVKNSMLVSLDRIMTMQRCVNPLCDHKDDGKVGSPPENIKNIGDLILLGKTYHCKLNKKYKEIDLEKVCKLVEPLEALNKMVGLRKLKEDIFGHITCILQNLQKDDMMHTIIEGPPGVGKTEIGKILGQIYVRVGVLSPNGPFRVVSRKDLIGKYLGHTAKQTQEMIDKCKGGVMFIDEAYALGNPEEGRDIFSKECLDTLNQNLSEGKNNFLCIVAGYPEDLERSFFSGNRGLRRRFTFRYSIDKYTAEELKDIFLKKVAEIDWKIWDDIKELKDASFFKEHLEDFPHFGGDIETFLLQCKMYHSKRVFSLDKDKKKVLVSEDITEGFKLYYASRGLDRKKAEKSQMAHMYV